MIQPEPTILSTVHNADELKTALYKTYGKADWALPDKDQLENIYQNLRKSGIVNDNTWNWGASTNAAGSAWVQNFSDGEHFYTTDKNYKLTVMERP